MSDSGPSSDPTSSGGAAVPQKVNAQIIDAVKESTSFVFNNNAGAAIAYDKAAQAGALALQDAADYQRNVLSVSNAALGKAIALIVANPEKNLIPALVVTAIATLNSFMATQIGKEIGTEVTTWLTEFPRS